MGVRPGFGRPGEKVKNEAREGRKRERPELMAYLTLGKAKHALFDNAGWNSSARCGCSPHWADPVGWCGNENDEEKEKLAGLPWCGRCAKLVIRDEAYLRSIPQAAREALQARAERLPGGGVLHKYPQK